MRLTKDYSRYAHTDGHTGGCYTDDGRYFITCGSDCDVRIWQCNDEDDDDPESLTIRDAATSIAFSKDKLYIGSGNFVHKYEHSDLTFCNNPLRFSAPVTHVDVSMDGKILVAASCDMKIKVLNLETGKITELSGHTAPVLRVALDTNVEFLASSSCDGSVKVWDIKTGETVISFKNMIPTCNDFFTAKVLGGPAWQGPNSKHLAVPNKNKVNVYSVEDWSVISEFGSAKLEKAITLTTFSPCGRFLCAATTVGEIVIWNFESRKVVSYTDHTNKVAISTLSWHPSKTEIAYCDYIGRLRVISPDLDKVLTDAVGETQSKQNQGNHETMENDESGDGGSECGSEDNENSISISKIKASSGLTNGEEEDVESVRSEAEGSEDEYVGNRVLTSVLQPCFQPSSTPTHFQHGYMVWNSIGIIRSFNSDADSSIDVEFHDTMFHHSIHRRNLENFALAALSSKLLCLASSSLITGIYLNGWDEKKEWTLRLPAGEDIVAMTASGNWVCCATDSNQLRFFTFTGVQRQVVSLSGPVVCINSSERFLIAVIHMGLGLSGCQNLGYVIFEVSDFFIKAFTPCQPLPLTPKEKLRWVGFTDEGTPCSYDTAGILRLSRDYLHWQVACDTRLHCKSKSDSYFLIGISEKLQSIRCILCKGSPYPMTLPRPTVVEIPLKLPLCEPAESKAVQEDIFWRHVFSYPAMEALAQDNYEYKTELKSWDKILKQAIIKLFAGACREKADMRAVNLASLMSEQPLEMAARFAKTQRRMCLVEKLHNMNPQDWSVLGQEKMVDSSLVDYSTTHLICNNVESSFRNEMRNKTSNKPSQGDMFEESQPSPTTANTTAASDKDKANSSFEEKRGASSTSSPATKPTNPFKVNNKDEGPKGLNFFNNVTQANLKPTKADTVDKLTKAKQSNVSKEKSSGSSHKKLRFVEWFNVQKTSLTKKFPNLNGSELTKIAMKIFREEMSQGNSKQEKEESSENCERDADMPGTKRRKVEDAKTDNSTVKTAAAEKLSAFNFIK